jgi:hypothetical protein
MSAAEEQTQRCPVICKKDGQPCSGVPTSSRYCVAHSPQSNEWRAAGGRATRASERAARALPSRLRPIAEGLDRAFAAVEAGKLDPKIANSMATLAGAIVKVFQATEYEQRLRLLEQRASDEGLLQDARGWRAGGVIAWPMDD